MLRSSRSVLAPLPLLLASAGITIPSAATAIPYTTFDLKNLTEDHSFFVQGDAGGTTSADNKKFTEKVGKNEFVTAEVDAKAAFIVAGGKNQGIRIQAKATADRLEDTINAGQSTASAQGRASASLDLPFTVDGKFVRQFRITPQAVVSGHLEGDAEGGKAPLPTYHAEISRQTGAGPTLRSFVQLTHPNLINKQQTAVLSDTVFLTDDADKTFDIGAGGDIGPQLYVGVPAGSTTPPTATFQPGKGWKIDASVRAFAQANNALDGDGKLKGTKAIADFMDPANDRFLDVNFAITAATVKAKPLAYVDPFFDFDGSVLSMTGGPMAALRYDDNSTLSIGEGSSFDALVDPSSSVSVLVGPMSYLGFGGGVHSFGDTTLQIYIDGNLVADAFIVEIEAESYAGDETLFEGEIQFSFIDGSASPWLQETADAIAGGATRRMSFDPGIIEATSDFAFGVSGYQGTNLVIPEPSTLVVVALCGAVLSGLARRRIR